MSLPIHTGGALLGMWLLATAAANGQDAGGDSLPAGANRQIKFDVEPASLTSKLRFSPDGRYIASHGSKTIKLSEAATGKLLWSAPGEQMLGRLAFSKDGKKLAILSIYRYLVYSTKSAEQLLSTYWLKDAGLIPNSSLAVSPDLETVARIRDGSIHLHDAETGKKLSSIDYWDETEPRSVFSVEFSPNGKSIYLLMSARLAPEGGVGKGGFGNKDLAGKPKVVEFDLQSRKQLQAFEIPRECTAAWLVVSADGHMLAVINRGSSKENPGVVLWDLKAGKAKHVLDKVLPGIACGGFSQDGRLFALGGTRATSGNLNQLPPNAPDIVILDTQSGKSKQMFQTPMLKASPVPPYIRDLAFAPNGKKVATYGSNTTLSLWDVEGN
jgi:WD40 repeat protein